MTLRTLALLFFFFEATFASAQSAGTSWPEVQNYVQGKVFEIYEPTVCAAPKTGGDGNYRIANVCTTPIEIVFCTNLSPDENRNTSCASPFELNIYGGGYLPVNHPGYSLQATNSRNKATAFAVFTCPVDSTVTPVQPYGRYFNVFSVERIGFAITGKCMRPVRDVQKSAVKRVVWPLYKDRLVIQVTGPGAAGLLEADPPPKAR